jgi:putative hydrolase of the HAD superfamily
MDRASRLNGHPSAIFFDMDGTLLDWESTLERDWRLACDAACRTILDGIDPASLYATIRESVRWFWADPDRSNGGRMDLLRATTTIVHHALDTMGVGRPDAAPAIASDYRRRRIDSIAPYPGALETLERVRSLGIRTALLTNGGADTQRRSVERFGLTRHFDCVVIEGEFGCGKPDPRVFQHALRSCDARPSDAWMVGDNLDADIAGAQAIGVHAVWCDYAGTGVPDGVAVRPDRIIGAITELLSDRA